ncbi:hypothetical protein [Roseospirillum parvum]|nr:hypothetical protein [Roseospirillum parvum]
MAERLRFTASTLLLGLLLTIASAGTPRAAEPGLAGLGGALSQAEGDIALACGTSLPLTVDESSLGGAGPQTLHALGVLGADSLAQAANMLCAQPGGDRLLAGQVRQVVFRHAYLAGEPYLMLQSDGTLIFELFFDPASQVDVVALAADLDRLLRQGF